MLEIHSKIRNKLINFIDIKKIPNIIFHGPSGGGKRSLVTDFINNIDVTYDEIELEKLIS